MKKRDAHHLFAAALTALFLFVFFSLNVSAQEAALNKPTAHGLTVTPDTIRVNEPFTLSWSVETPGATSHVQIWYDNNNNGVIDTLVDYKMFDSVNESDMTFTDGGPDDSDSSANGTYVLAIGEKDFWATIGTLIFFAEENGVSDTGTLVMKGLDPTNNSISGTVTYPANTKNLAVTAILNNGNGDGLLFAGITDGAGAFTINIPDSLNGSTLSLGIDTESSPTDAWKSLVVPSRQDVVVNGHVTGQDLAFTTPTAYIYGDILDKNGNKITKSIWMELSDSNDGSGKTVSSGSYLFGVTPGTWHISVSNEDLAPDYIAPNFWTQDSSYFITVTAGDSIRKDIVCKTADATITGIVSAGKYIPLKDVDVSAYNDSSNASAKTDANGQFTLYVSSTETYHMYVDTEDLPDGYSFFSTDSMYTPGTASIFLEVKQTTLGGTNVMVNSLSAGNQNTDGGRSIAVSGSSVYTVWTDWAANTVYCSKSADGGASFGAAARVSSIPDTALQAFPAIAADANGTVYAAWSLFNMATETAYGVAFAKSTDGGQTFSKAALIDNPAGVMPSIAANGNNVYIFFAVKTSSGMADYYFTRSTDGGSSFDTPFKVNDADQAASKWEDMTAIALDNSGNIYVAWNDGRNATPGAQDADLDIYCAKSTDGGSSFGTNVPVNNLSDANHDQLQYSPALAADANGAVYATWRIQTYQSGDKKVMCSKSADGSAFTGHTMVSVNESQCGPPDIAVNGNGEVYIAYPGYRNGTPDIFLTKSVNQCETFHLSVMTTQNNYNVSYPSIIAGQDNAIYMIWTDERSGSGDVYFAKGSLITGIKIDDTDTRTIPEEFELAQNYPNPFNPETTIRFRLASASDVTLTIYNIFGQEITKLVQKHMPAGTYSARWDGTNTFGVRVASGVYFYRLNTKDFSQVKRMVLLK